MFRLMKLVIVVLCAAMLLPAAAFGGNMQQWGFVGGSWVQPRFATGDFTHGIAIHQASGGPNAAILTDAAGAYEYYAGGNPQYVYDATVLGSTTVRDAASDDTLNGSRVFITDGTGVNEYLWGGGGYSLNSNIATGAGFTAGEISRAQDRYWAVWNGDILEYNRTEATTWAQNGDVFAGDYVDVAARAVNTGIVMGLRDTGFDEFQGGALVRSHNNLFSGATGIATWSDYDNVFVSTTSGLLHLARDVDPNSPTFIQFTVAGITVIDNSAGYLDVDTLSEVAGTAFDVWAVQVPEPTTAGLLICVLLGWRRRR